MDGQWVALVLRWNGTNGGALAHLVAARRVIHELPTLRSAVATAAKLIFASTDVVDARRRRDEFVKRFAKTAPKSVACLEDGFDDAMAVMALPEKYRRRLRTTNMMERLNEGIRRRERVTPRLSQRRLVVTSGRCANRRDQ